MQFTTKGLLSVLRSIPGSRGVGSGLPGYHQINKVIITKSPPNRSGHMLMGKTNNTVHPGYAFYLRGTETAEAEGLWLSEYPNASVKTPDDSNSSSQSPQAQLHSPFILPSLYCTREPHDII